MFNFIKNLFGNRETKALVPSPLSDYQVQPTVNPNAATTNQPLLPPIPQTFVNDFQPTTTTSFVTNGVRGSALKNTLGPAEPEQSLDQKTDEQVTPSQQNQTGQGAANGRRALRRRWKRA